MRICVVGCGAVGCLVRREPRRRWTTSRCGPTTSSREHVDAINANGLRLTGARRRLGAVARDRRGRAAACEFGIVATKAMFTGAAIAATAHAFADGASQRPERRRQRGGDRRARRARDPRHDLPGRASWWRPASSRWTPKGDTWIGPFERARRRWRRSSASPTRCTRGGMPTKAVADARGPQWRR